MGREDLSAAVQILSIELVRRCSGAVCLNSVLGTKSLMAIFMVLTAVLIASF
jgi:hypothetical protein